MLFRSTPEMQDLTAIHAGLSNSSVRRSGDNSPARPIETIELHVNGTPENLESIVGQKLSELDPDLTVQRVVAFGEQVSEAMNFERLLARLTTFFGILGTHSRIDRSLWRHRLHSGAAHPRDRHSRRCRGRSDQCPGVKRRPETRGVRIGAGNSARAPQRLADLQPTV